ncbi:Flp pilus assembly complex ATPase component [Paenibacillus sp. 7124]|uniref:Flp pilus assembly complex ATPase component n=1 Tax=Paenibacillus apii TaxID=1850370 RepID=A0A6M1PJW9_9BACL|nr:ATPase, T2SS/T4P/T4SS family [Paenibacillus apii]NGM82642.1 Flp pilus assembly complex ATPase component [Paenibacillus apii]
MSDVAAFGQSVPSAAGSPFSLKQSVLRGSTPGKEDFPTFLQKMKREMNAGLEREDEAYFELNAKALTGDPQAVSFFMNEIEKYLRKTPFTGSVPEAYDTAAEALFHEWKGFGPAYRWFTDRAYSESTGLQIIGRQIFFNVKGKFVPYPYEMPSLDRVEQLKRSLLKSDPNKKLNKDNPSVEFKMDDPLWPGRFIRLAIWVSPRVWEGFTTISMRRQVVEFLDLDDQAGTECIPAEAVSMIRALAMTFRNTIIAGSVGSGKTTFANTIVGEQLLGSTSCMGVVMIEKHPESTLPYQIKGHRIIPIQAANEELMEVGIESLRHDPNLLYMTEMRYNEWEFYLWSGEKGYDGITGTFHTVDSEDIPYQGAFAVSTRIGGSLKGHLVSALKACEMVFILESAGEGRKRLASISEVFYDEAKGSVFANDLMRWDREKQSWTYNAEITEGLFLKMRKRNAEAAGTLLDSLKRLAGEKLLSSPLRESLKSRIVLNE